MLKLFSLLAKAVRTDMRLITQTVGVACSLEHFMPFDCTAVAPIAEDIMRTLNGNYFPPEQIFLPWDCTWLESGDFAAILVREGDDANGAGFAFSAICASQEHASGFRYFPNIMKVPPPASGLHGTVAFTIQGIELTERLKRHFTQHLNLAYCFLSFINEPTIFPRESLPAHRGLQKAINAGARRGLSLPFQFRPWTVLRMPLGGHQSHADDSVTFACGGKRGLHKVKAYLRHKPRRRIVFEHFRGDARLGVCLSARELYQPETARA